jgi:hypothetical protein
MPIIVSQDGKKTQKYDKSSFVDENQLQQYIHKNPESIPIYEIDEDINLKIIKREFPTNSGPIDALGVDQNGNIYIIETKLFKNTDKRQVLAQVLDYGAALWKHLYDFSDFYSILDNEINLNHGVSFQEYIKSEYSLSDEDHKLFMDNLRNCLNNAQYCFIVLMDQLHDNLKDLIIFMNQNSNFNIYAVELEFYKVDKLEIMIPKLFGNSVKKSKQQTTSTRQAWTESMLLEDAKSKLKPDEFFAFEKLYQYFTAKADSVNFGTGTTYGSFNPIFLKICPRSVVTVRTDGKLSPNYGWFTDSDLSRAKGLLLKNQLIKYGFKFETNQKFPIIYANQWAEKVDDLIKIIEEVIS